MKRYYYIANAYDGQYFFLSENLDDYHKKMLAYVVNLERSRKLNHYQFGSVELTAREFEELGQKASAFEGQCLQEKREVKKDPERPPLQLL